MSHKHEIRICKQKKQYLTTGFADCIRENTNIEADNAKVIAVLNSMYNLIL